MRRLFLLTTMLFALLCVNANAQILFTENFDYPAGDSIGAHGWVWNTGTTNTIKVATSGLDFPGYSLSGIGNQCHLMNNGNDAYKPIIPDSTGSIYTSFMIAFDSIRTGGDYFFALLPGNSTTNYAARFYAKDSSGGIAFGCSKGASGTNPISWTGGTYSLLTIYTVVIKYTFNTGTTTDDEIRVYIFDSSFPGTEPGSPTLGPITGPATDMPNYGRVALRQGSNTISPTCDIDGIRVSKSWSNMITAVNPVSTVAEKFGLSQNYPNPFNPQTKINFSIPEAGFVTLKVYDMLGKEVSELVNGNYARGEYVADFNALGLSSGIYMYKIDVKGINGNIFSDIRKMTLVK